MFIKYCVFSKILKYTGLLSLSVFTWCQCGTHTGQVEHQRCIRTGKVQKNHNILMKNTIFNEHPVGLLSWAAYAREWDGVYWPAELRVCLPPVRPPGHPVHQPRPQPGQNNSSRKWWHQNYIFRYFSNYVEFFGLTLFFKIRVWTFFQLLETTQQNFFSGCYFLM